MEAKGFTLICIPIESIFEENNTVLELDTASLDPTTIHFKKVQESSLSAKEKLQAFMQGLGRLTGKEYALDYMIMRLLLKTARSLEYFFPFIV